MTPKTLTESVFLVWGLIQSPLPGESRRVEPMKTAMSRVRLVTRIRHQGEASERIYKTEDSNRSCETLLRIDGIRTIVPEEQKVNDSGPIRSASKQQMQQPIVR